MYTGEEPSVGDSNLALNLLSVATATTPAINKASETSMASSRELVGRKVLGRVDDSKTECGAGVAVLAARWMNASLGRLAR